MSKAGRYSRARGKPNASLVQCYRWIHAVLLPNDRRRWVWLMALSALVGLIEALGVLSILPFLAIVSDPGLLERPGPASWVYTASGFDTVSAFQIALGFGVLVVLIIGIALRLWRIVLHTQFARRQAVALSCTLLRVALHRPYPWHLGQHSSQIGAGVLSEVERVVTGAVSSSVEFVASVAVVLSVLAILLAADPISALFIFVTLGGAYGAVIMATRPRLRRLGTARMEANRDRFRVVSEALGGIKEVKLLRVEEGFLQAFQVQAAKAARARARIAQIVELPRGVLEVLVYGGMMAFVLVALVRADNDLASAIPIIGLFAFAGVRTFPVVQMLYRAYSVIQADSPALNALRQDLAEAPEPPRLEANPTPLRLSRGIALKSLVYSYDIQDRPSLTAPKAWIIAGQRTAIAGPSGAGKSTLIDLLLGLLTPDSGGIFIDDTELTDENRARWQANIGFVPQDIYLLDDTIAANIRFGRLETEGDAQRLNCAAKAASIDHFINTLPQGFDTPVGERGVRLSGGQAQRIAIARALYDDPQVLILDEPTSALDAATETDVLNGISGAMADRTVLIVTHRQPTIAACDHVLRIENGRIDAVPKPENSVEEAET